jgi:hypothetical protein
MEHTEDESVSFYKGPTVGLCLLECLKTLAYGDAEGYKDSFERLDHIYSKRLMAQEDLEDPLLLSGLSGFLWVLLTVEAKLRREDDKENKDKTTHRRMLHYAIVNIT